MCGIIGYVGQKQAVPILLDGLRRLEYRGYDSAGIASLTPEGIQIHRCVGKLTQLEQVVQGKKPTVSTVGIGHTRWATHGRPSEENAHPHRAGSVVVVHNGIIENYLDIKHALQAKGRVFQSETDTEVIPHLMDEYLKAGEGFEAAVRHALSDLKGAYAVCAVCDREPNRIVAARQGCPLVVGIGENELFAASDIPAVLPYTRRVLFLEDGELVVLDGQGCRITTLQGAPVQRSAQAITWDPVMAEKGGYKHFMLKEIHEQPQALMDTVRGRLQQEKDQIHLDELGLRPEAVAGMRRGVLVACGTSWHAALVGRYLIEDLARLPIEVEIGSEFRYRDPLVDEGTLFLAISQSGETADTLAAMREARSKGARCLAVCNVVGSTMAREADGVLYTHAGPEIGVAATKTFTTQLTALLLLAIHLGRQRGTLDARRVHALSDEILSLPRLIEEWLKGNEKRIEDLARRFSNYSDFLYLGRGIHYPIALEGALKLKELSYIHAEGYPAGEMKHGPIALIDEVMPVVILAPPDKVYDKVMSNLMEVKARSGIVIAVGTEGDKGLAERADAYIPVPAVSPYLMPILMTVPLQLLAYHIAIRRGCDVDQPRNLAKSVTVE